MIKIVAIDDNNSNLLSLKMFIGKALPEAIVSTALNGKDGIEQVIRHQPDVVLLDIKMPEMDGFEVCKILKRNKLTQDIPVVFITSFKGDVHVEKKAINAGGEVFLSKPFSEAEFVAQVKAMVKIKTAAEKQRSVNEQLEKLVALRTKKLKQELLSRQNAEHALREKEEILKQAQQIAKLGSWEYNVETGTVNWSENNFRILGLQHNEITPTLDYFISRIHPDDVHRVLNDLKVAETSAGAIVNEFRITGGVNSYKWIQHKIVPFFKSKKLVYLKGVNIDITERKLAEEALINEKRKTEEQNCLSKTIAEISTDLIDAGPDNVDLKIEHALSKVGLFSGADHAFIFQFREKSTLIENTHEWCLKKITRGSEKIKDLTILNSSQWMNMLANKEPVLINRIENIPAENAGEKDFLLSQKITSLVAVPVFKGEEFLGFMGLSSVNEEKDWQDYHVQICKAAANSIASALFSVRNQNQLLIAKEHAEESDRLKSAFLANMSHEIRTPMNGILGFIDLLHNSHLTRDEKNLYSSMIRKSSARLLTTINDIIEISKIESGQTPVVYSVENVNEIMNYLQNIFQPEAEEKGLNLKISDTSENNLLKTVAIRTDKIKLESILKNLLNNAIKFTNHGTVEFGYHVQDKTITFCIKDTGPGIAQDRIDVIFDRFVQADLDITRPYEGSGLGLSITRAYAEMLKGKIWVESEVGIGSRFYFSLNHDSIVSEK